MLVCPPYPYYPNPDEFDLEAHIDFAWIARPQLFFKSTIRPIGGNEDGTDDMELTLMFYSTLERIVLTPDHPLQQAGMEMFYEPMPEPFLYVDHISHAQCRVPLTPVFMQGNKTPTIPSKFARQKNQLFQYGQADTPRKEGSKLYEVNHFIWNFGCPKARINTVAQAMAARKQVQEIRARKISESRKKNSRIAAGGTDTVESD
jgi:hypothetical protein